MFKKLLILMTVFITSCSSTQKLDVVVDDQKSSNRSYVLPDLDLSPQEIEKKNKELIKTTDLKISELLKKTEKHNFENTTLELDYIMNDMYNHMYVIYLLLNTSPKKEVRDAALQAFQDLQKWEIDLSFRKDLYKAYTSVDLKKLNDTQKRYMEKILLGFKMNGLHLSDKKQNEIKKITQELAKLTTEFGENIKNAKAEFTFTKEEIKGVPESYLKKWETEDGNYKLDALIYDDYGAIIKFADNREVRKKVYLARNTSVKKENLPLVQKIANKRLQIAKLLGYDTWADVKLEDRMAKSPEKVSRFLGSIKSGLIKKQKQELKEIKQKMPDSKDTLYSWDTSYYFDKIAKDKYNYDSEYVKQYFPMESSLQGMFSIYQKIFQLDFKKIEPLYKWTEDVELYGVYDQKSQELLGMFYLDLYPREGKYNHFAQFTLAKGLRLKNGKYQAPIAVLVCNFPQPTEDTPSLLKHSDVETLFHEFGHAIHTILTKAEYIGQSGTAVPRDFVEAPSQMLENWLWNKDVLDSFAHHYQDKSKKLPSDTLDKMKQVKKASLGRQLTFQLGVADLDMTLHSAKNPLSQKQISKISGEKYQMMVGAITSSEVSFITRLGHFTGYDAGYYGYLWAQAISDDLNTAFESAENKYFDESVGLKLRTEIYEPGDSRPVEESIHEFLGRDWNTKAFIKNLGI
ncbi:MAG: Zn-dependent oligopeptidase [Bdellovibrionales bacterium]|nr:Zn-dependent oligopeptidase [Bdellovibrionales bacterium]